MARTRSRALPAGLIEPHKALTAGVGLVLFGVLLLTCAANLLTGFLVLLAAFLYLLVYTPLKRLTWLNTSFGAIHDGTLEGDWRHSPLSKPLAPDYFLPS